MKKGVLFFCLLFISSKGSPDWGFFAHQMINRLAVFTLPPEMIGFYKKHIGYLAENAVNPDKRRYAVEWEGARHYIDLDVYGDSAAYKLPRSWAQAVKKFSEDTLNAYGIVPWHIHFMKYRLTEAFKKKDTEAILKLSSELGHYIADANVPLHTTENYNGQLTGQHGIHGFWESRLPELFYKDYDFFVGRAEYLIDTQVEAWRAVLNAHQAVDSVLDMEKELNDGFRSDRKYSYEKRGTSTVKVYSKKYSEKYHKMLNGMVERQMRASVKMTGNFWYTAWVDAGQPDLSKLRDSDLEDFKIDSTEKQSSEHAERNKKE